MKRTILAALAALALLFALATPAFADYSPYCKPYSCNITVGSSLSGAQTKWHFGGASGTGATEAYGKVVRYWKELIADPSGATLTMSFYLSGHKTPSCVFREHSTLIKHWCAGYFRYGHVSTTIDSPNDGVGPALVIYYFGDQSGKAAKANQAASALPRLTAAPAGARYCPGVTDQRVGLAYDFDEAPGSTVFHASSGAPATDLRVEPGYHAPSATGSAAIFDNAGLLVTAGNVFSPENLDFTVCAKFSDDADDDSYNLWQVNNSHPAPSPVGMIKQTGWYNYVAGTRARFRVHTNVATARGTGYHWVTFARRGDTYRTYWDGGLAEVKTWPGIGPVHLTWPLAVGAKITPGGHTSSEDSLKGRVAALWLAAR